MLRQLWAGSSDAASLGAGSEEPVKIPVVSAFRRTCSGPAEAGHYVRRDFFTGAEGPAYFWGIGTRSVRETTI